MSRLMTSLVAVVAVVAVVFIMGVSPPARAQPFPGAPTPPRDAQPKTGTARIRGLVVAADTGQPLRRTQIRAVAPELRETRLTSTDAAGRYELKELPAGRYQLSATKGSYVTLSYGQSRPFEAGKPLEILDGQTVERVDFALPRGGIVTGRIIDEFGEAASDVQVMPMRYQYVQGRRRLTPAGRVATTNDIGEYRIFGLAPGQYYLSAAMRGGNFVGAFGESDDRSGYAPTYYPGTANAAEAQRITLGIAQTLSEINMTLVVTRTVRVSGTAVDSQARPLAGGMIMVMQRSGATVTSTGFNQIRPDGSFVLSNLAPGEYVIQAMTMGAFSDVSELASAQITVAGEDISGVQLVGQKSVLGTGRIVVDPAAARSLSPSTLRFTATPAHPEDNLLAGIGSGKVNDDFTFEVKARPGLALIRPMTLPPGWGLQAVRLNGADVTDIGIEFRPNEDIGGIEIELTNHPTEVSGLVTNSRGEAIKDYSVIVFARDRERWGHMSRYFQTGRPDQDGRFKVRALPSGEYYAVAVDYVEPGDIGDPEFLERIKTRATTFSLGEGETKALDLKLNPAT